MKKVLLLSLIGLSVLHGSLSYAESIPRGGSADKRVKRVMYDPNNVVVLKGSYGFQTQITFAPNETIESVAIGDSLAWQTVPTANNLFIKPVASSKTNMTVLTNLNSYSFHLDSNNPANAPTYKLQFLYPNAGFDQMGRSNAVATFDPEKLNWRYSFTGDRLVAPIEAFDNGKFTYLRFKEDGSSRLPSIFIADEHRNEMLINYHMQGKYVVINKVANQLTLRDGDFVATVYNDYAIGDWKYM